MCMYARMDHWKEVASQYLPSQWHGNTEGSLHRLQSLAKRAVGHSVLVKKRVQISRFPIGQY